jgi:DNA-directed RNA polymerase subunit RPC12/RpoP
MMVELSMLRDWTQALGLRVKRESETDGLQVALPITGAPRFTIKPDGRESTWSITHERQLSSAIVDSQWGIGGHDDSPISRLTKTIHRLATGFLVLHAEVFQDGSDVVIEFTAPIYGEGLTKQAFALTLSSVMKAVEAFDLLIAQRAEQVAALKEFETKEVELKKMHESQLAELTKPLPEAAAPTTRTSKSGCPHCGTELPAGAVFCAACGKSVLTAPSATPVASPGRRCSRCGQQVISSKKFCTGCGAPLT